jgi:hypothetical protein
MPLVFLSTLDMAHQLSLLGLVVSCALVAAFAAPQGLSSDNSRSLLVTVYPSGQGLEVPVVWTRLRAQPARSQHLWEAQQLRAGVSWDGGFGCTLASAAVFFLCVLFYACCLCVFVCVRPARCQLLPHNLALLPGISFTWHTTKRFAPR